MRSSLALVVLVAWGAGSSPVNAQNRVSLTVGYHVMDIDGDFDDSLLLEGRGTVYNVPALESAPGYSFSFGGITAGGTWAITHFRSDPEATSVLGNTTAALRTWEFDVARYPWLKPGAIQVSPGFHGGLTFNSLKVFDSVADGTELLDATYHGVGFNLGISALLRVGNIFHVSADLTRRFLKFVTVSAGDESVISLEEDLNASPDVSPRHVHRLSPNARLRNEIMPSIPARKSRSPR